jgi:glycosyltransferase involved in cell wall biosynthesis
MALGVRGGDVAGVAAAVEQALSDPDRARRWAGEGRRRVLERFDFGAHVERVQDLYARLLAGRA